MRAAPAALLSALLGAALGLAAVAATPGDPTDGWFLYGVALPVGAVGVGVIAWFRPRGAWAHGLLFGLGLWLGEVLGLGDPGNLWPLSLVFHLVIAMPIVLVGVIAAIFPRRCIAQSHGTRERKEI